MWRHLEWWVANFAMVILAIVVAWDALVYFGIVSGHTITHEIRQDWRGWVFFVCAGVIAGGHFLSGK